MGTVSHLASYGWWIAPHPSPIYLPQTKAEAALARLREEDRLRAESMQRLTQDKASKRASTEACIFESCVLCVIGRGIFGG